MTKVKVIVIIGVFYAANCVGQVDSTTYNVLRIDLKEKVVAEEIKKYAEEVFVKEQALMDDSNGVLEVHIYEERDGIKSYYIDYIMHEFETTDRPPDFYTIIGDNIVLLHTTRTVYLKPSMVNFDSFLPLISSKLYKEPTLSYHPKVWLVKTKDGDFLEKRELEYFDYKDQ